MYRSGMDLLVESWLISTQPYVSPKQQREADQKLREGNRLMAVERERAVLDLKRRLRPLIGRLAMLEVRWYLRQLSPLRLVINMLAPHGANKIDFELSIIAQSVATINENGKIIGLEDVSAVDAITFAYKMGGYTIGLARTDDKLVVSSVEW